MTNPEQHRPEPMTAEATFETWKKISRELSESQVDPGDKEKHKSQLAVIYELMAAAEDEALIEMAKYEKAQGDTRELWVLLDMHWAQRRSCQKHLNKPGVNIYDSPGPAFFKHLAQIEEAGTEEGINNIFKKTDKNS